MTRIVPRAKVTGTMRISIAQLNPIVGDLKGNRRLIEQAVVQARSAGAHLLICPELCVCGYPPKDLLLRQGFVEACDRMVADLARLTDDRFGMIVGYPTAHGCADTGIANAAGLLAGGRVAAVRRKVLLPNYDVFDEKRYFLAGTEVAPIEFQGIRLGLHVCEDAWWGEPDTFYHCEPVQPNPVAELASQGVDLFINISASPYQFNKMTRRHGIVRRHVVKYGKPFLLANQVGGNDDLVFDGNSFLMDAAGEVRVSLNRFRPDLATFDLEAPPNPVAVAEDCREKQLLDALTLGLHDYGNKTGFTDCVLGLSGGVDSALAALIASRAFGPEHVHGLLMPSRHSSEHSINDARELAENLGIHWSIVPIDAVHRAYEMLPAVGVDLSSQPGGLADQNLQARIRGAIVMTRSNRHGWLALATGNKSELAVGYCTLYGDMSGGFAVLADLYKQDVYAISRFVNQQAGRDLIPRSTLQKAPSAELAPNQFDQDTLPPYEILDAILRGLIDDERSPADLAREFPRETVLWVVRRLDRNEFKRRQMPPGIKLSERAFGTGRRMPMAARGFEGLDP